MIRLNWVTILGHHGYGHIGKQLPRALKMAGAVNLPDDQFGWDASIVVHPPTLASHVGPSYFARPDLVFHTMCETDRIPASWVDIMNRAGLIWVPSTYCREVFKAAGVQTPMMQTSYGVEVNLEGRELHGGPFRVLAWGDALYSRKNIIQAIEAFIAADLPHAEMEIKLGLGDLPIPQLHWMDESGKQYENIRIIHADWHEQKLIKWLHSGDVGIYLSGGEGYGLMPMQMMATGLPIISVINTGMCDYLDPSVIMHVPCGQAVSPFFENTSYPKGATGYMPDKDAAVDHLRRAYRHQSVLYKFGLEGAEYIRKYTWESVGRSAYNQLMQHFGL